MGELGIRRTHDPAGKWRADPLGRTPLTSAERPKVVPRPLADCGPDGPPIDSIAS